MLSFGIPAYRGVRELCRTLDVLSNFRNDLDFETIVFCNGWSPDASIKSRYDFANFSFSLQVVPPDLSHCRVISECSSEYVYLIGDDDGLTEYQMMIIKDVLERKNIDLLVFRAGQVKKYVEYSSFNEFFINCYGALKLGNFLFKKDLFYNSSALLDTAHAYTSFLFGLIEKSEINAVIIQSNELLYDFGDTKTYRKNMFDIYFRAIPTWFNVLYTYAVKQCPSAVHSIKKARRKFYLSLLSPRFMIYFFRPMLVRQP